MAPHIFKILSVTLHLMETHNIIQRYLVSSTTHNAIFPVTDQRKIASNVCHFRLEIIQIDVISVVVFPSANFLLL